MGVTWSTVTTYAGPPEEHKIGGFIWGSGPPEGTPRTTSRGWCEETGMSVADVYLDQKTLEARVADCPWRSEDSVRTFISLEAAQKVLGAEWKSYAIEWGLRFGDVELR